MGFVCLLLYRPKMLLRVWRAGLQEESGAGQRLGVLAEGHRKGLGEGVLNIVSIVTRTSH